MSYLTYADIWLSFGCHLVAVLSPFGCQVGKPQHYQGVSGIRGMTKMEEKDEN